MQDYKTPLARLARSFKNGRAQWKTRALARQGKLRKQKVTLRDTEASRNRWKQKATTLKAENARLSRELKSAQTAKKKSNQSSKRLSANPA